LTAVNHVGSQPLPQVSVRVNDADPLGSWSGDQTPTTDPAAIAATIHNIRRPVRLVRVDDRYALVEGGTAVLDKPDDDSGNLPIVGYASPCPLKHLGDRSFLASHGLRLAYVGGAMANGISSVRMVEALGQAGMLGFFGAAGLTPAKIESAIHTLQASLDPIASAWGCNLIHSPNDPQLEAAVADLYLRRGVRLVEASAYINLTLPVVRYRVHGIRRDAQGKIIVPNRIIAKVSRVEVATRFFSPPPAKMLAQLVALGQITADQAEMASHIPMAQDLTAEADSGGHTDNRPAMSLLPTMMALRDQMQNEHRYDSPLRVGAAGGIATPASAAAAFAMGAAYILTGSVNQACVESGSADAVRKMLAEAGQADVTMAASADMFEMGVKVQVLKRGTMFAMRASKLHELYRTCTGLDDIPADQRASLEKNYFRAGLDEIWQQTRRFFTERDPSQVDKAQRDPKHKMALVFRWYLGKASQWANSGDPSRTIDYQIWCGPAMGAFNQWAKGSGLEQPENRRVVDVAMNILYGAAVLTRVNMLTSQGVSLPSEVAQVLPVSLTELEERLQ